MTSTIKTIKEIVDFQLCCGCGACAYAEPLRYKMAPVVEFGNRPFLLNAPAPESGDALTVCPAIELSLSDEYRKIPGVIGTLYDGWGPVLAVWEGYATDNAVRFAGSSGGLATALSAYCLERQGMSLVLHTSANSDRPYLNETAISSSVDQLLSRTGSRYAPASPAEGLAAIENAAGPCVFIGKPCDVAAVQKARKIRERLDNNLGLVISFFCAGTPSTQGTFDLLQAQGITVLSSLKELRYRGNGWPGQWAARFEIANNETETRYASYAESWGFLQKYRQWRCYICPDHTGEFSDIALGDPWYRAIVPGELGKSLIVARSQRGYDLIKSAEAAGYIVLEKEDPELLPQSQPNLLATRGAVWARIAVLRMLGIKSPKYSGFRMFKFWLSRLTLKEQLQSYYGTFKRVFVKKLYKRVTAVEWKQGHDQ